MPTIHIDMFSGRTPKQKKDLVRLVTDAAVEAIGARREGVRVRINEIERYHHADGGVLHAEPPEA